MNDLPLPSILLGRGLLLWRGMARLRVPIDGFILALVVVLLAATLLPCQGESAQLLGLLGKCAIGALFFLQGARLSARTVRNGITHWRLHLFVGATTFLVFPLLGLGLLALFPHLLPNSLWLGVLFVCALPSTVQSSIALTSMARGDVSAAICTATLSNVVGVALTPLLFGAMSHLHGGGIDPGAILQVGVQLLLPFFGGHVLRPWLGAWAERNRNLTSITDRGSILLIVYTAFSAAVLRGIWHSLPLATLITLGLIMAGMLASVLTAIMIAGRALGFDKPAEIALLFCGSQKSLVSGVPIANALASGALVGPLLLPIMLYHPIQLLVCTWIARSYLRAEERVERGAVSARPSVGSAV
jgi:solute carrier family 10 (sodium/bile acid cotransporter), member 7